MTDEPRDGGEGGASRTEGAAGSPVGPERGEAAGAAGAQAPPPSPYGYPGWEEEISLLDLVNVLLRNRWTIAAVSAAVPVLVVIVTIFSSPSWTATASFMPQTGGEGASSRLANLAGQFGVNVPTEGAGNSPQFYADLLTSREILSAVAANTFRVVVDTATGETRTGTLADLREVEGESAALRRAATMNWLREEAISVSTGTETGVIDLEVTTGWPDLSAAIAGRLVDLVNQFNLETRQTQAAEERRFIGERVEEARADLRSAENELETFLQNNRQFQNSPELVFQHDRLQREVAMRQQVYNSLVQNYEQARISEVRNTPVITVIEDAEAPVRSDSKRLPLKAALGLVLGGMLGVFVAFGREYLSRNREEGSEDYREFNSLREETVHDVRRFLARLKRMVRRGSSGGGPTEASGAGPRGSSEGSGG